MGCLFLRIRTSPFETLCCSIVLPHLEGGNFLSSRPMVGAAELSLFGCIRSQLWALKLSSCGTQAYLLLGKWVLGSPIRDQTEFPELQGGFLSTGLQGSPQDWSSPISVLSADQIKTPAITFIRKPRSDGHGPVTAQEVSEIKFDHLDLAWMWFPEILQLF